jgi:hypothetical protein
MKLVKRLIIYLAVFIFIAAVVYGGTLGDFEETETVGSVMCLSCMGIE